MDQPKGIDVVKEATCKLKFNQQLRKSEGTKTPKVELTISIDGVAIQEPKTKTTPKVKETKKKKKSFQKIQKNCKDKMKNFDIEILFILLLKCDFYFCCITANYASVSVA